MATIPPLTLRSGLRAAAPAPEDLIADILAYYQATDPQDNYGFSTRELWDYRFETYGYVRLFADWLLVAEER